MDQVFANTKHGPLSYLVDLVSVRWLQSVLHTSAVGNASNESSDLCPSMIKKLVLITFVSLHKIGVYNFLIHIIQKIVYEPLSQFPWLLLFYFVNNSVVFPRV